MIGDKPPADSVEAGWGLSSNHAAGAQGGAAAAQVVPDAREALIKRLFFWSWVVNVLLLFLKIIALLLSNGSKAVAASVADSAVDVLSQVVLALSRRYVERPSENYPVGRARLEAMGVIACSCIMVVASIEVLQAAAEDLWDGVHGEIPVIDAGLSLYLILGGGVAVKLGLWLWCGKVKPQPDALQALAEDHINDVVSNIGAVVTASVAASVASAWWLDSVGAIVISTWIIWRWLILTREQTGKVVGRIAPPEFIRQCEALVLEHYPEVELDVARAYHWGARYIVEMEVVLPPETPLSITHDVALELQQRLEALDEVERAFVHIDYMKRSAPEHKVERQLLLQDPRPTLRSRLASLVQRGQADAGSGNSEASGLAEPMLPPRGRAPVDSPLPA